MADDVSRFLFAISRLSHQLIVTGIVVVIAVVVVMLTMESRRLTSNLTWSMDMVSN